MNRLRHKEKDTVKVVILISDTCFHSTEYRFGYAVRELKSSLEAGTPLVTCCDYYWEEVFYLDENKKPLPKSVIVWQSKLSNWENKKNIPTT